MKYFAVIPIVTLHFFTYFEYETEIHESTRLPCCQAKKRKTFLNRK